MVKVKMFLCACLCILVGLAALAKGDTIRVENISWMFKKHPPYVEVTLSDLIVYGDPNDPDPDTGNTKEKVILAPNDKSDDVVIGDRKRRLFHVGFKIAKFELSSPMGDTGEDTSVMLVGTIVVPKDVPKKKKVGFIRDPDEQVKVVLAIDGAVAPEPPPVGTILAFVDGYNELMPGWFVGTGIDYDTGEVTGAYTGIVEVLSTVFEVTLFDFYPPDGAVDIPLDDDLCWPVSEEAVLCDVYFGTNFNDVKYGRIGTFKGSQLGTTYDPGTLEPCTTYFWRINPVREEIDEPPDEPLPSPDPNKLPPDWPWLPPDPNKPWPDWPPIILDSAITTSEVRIYADMYSSGEAVLGDVWSFTTGPAKATNPYPVNGAIHVGLNVLLSWTPGCLAAFNDVYFGIDFYAVANADTSDTTGIYRGRQAVDVNSYDPGGLEQGTSYYWKIEGVNEPNKPPPKWQSPPWSFMTADYLVLDDMESYTDDLGNRIFETWIDGLGYPDPPPGHIGNGTGATVGYSDAPSVEQTIVYEGAQSMPFSYDNSGSYRKALYSEAKWTFDTPQDWVRCGVTALSLWFYGDQNNDLEPMYVAVVDSMGISAVVYHDNPAAAQTDTWTGWNTDLEDFADQGVDLADVNSIAIGFGDRAAPQLGGRGTVYFDNITLRTDPCPIADDPNECKVYIETYYHPGLGPISMTSSSPWTFEDRLKPIKSVEEFAYVEDNGGWEVIAIDIVFEDGDYFSIGCRPDYEQCKLEYTQSTSKEGVTTVTVTCTAR